jgi:hypothetical protein
MITDAVQRVASLAGRRANVPIGKPAFQPRERYKVGEFDISNFKTVDPRPGTVAFLDGGNLPLIEAPSFAVHFERIYYSVFDGDKRAQLDLPSRIEFFVVVTSSGEKDEIIYETHLVPLDEGHKDYLPDEKDLVFDSYDKTMRTGLERTEIPRVGDVARSFAEWGYASFVCDRLGADDIFVRDGTLHAPYTNQTAYAEETYDVARKRGVLFCGVSKTSHLYTTTGLPLVSAIARLAREAGVRAPWYYENIVEITDPAHRADMNFARFGGDYIFRIEVLKGQEDDKEKMMSALAANSRDLSFPGYPYGLVDADKNARVSQHELEPLRMLLFSQIPDIKDLLAGSDAHDWLNKI